jgi:hypothetical protein
MKNEICYETGLGTGAIAVTGTATNQNIKDSRTKGQVVTLRGAWMDAGGEWVWEETVWRVIGLGGLAGVVISFFA